MNSFIDDRDLMDDDEFDIVDPEEWDDDTDWWEEEFDPEEWDED